MQSVQNEVVLLDIGTIDQQIALYKQSFEIDDTIEQLKPFWEKKHYHNPLGKSLIFGVFIEGELAGMNAYLPCLYQYKNIDVLCLQSCESGVDPKFQGKGIWSRIVKYAVDYIFTETSFDLIIGFPNYRNSYPGFVKMKWDTITNMDNYIMVNNPAKFANSISQNRIIKYLSPLLSLQKTLIKIKNKGCKNLVIEECAPEDFGPVCSNDRISLKPSAEWLKWKSEYKNEHYLLVLCEEKKIATCAFFIDHFGGETVIRLDTIIYTNENRLLRKEVLSSIIHHLSCSYPQAAFIRTWTQKDSQFDRDIRGLLFIKSSHPNPFIIKQPKKEFDGIEWNLSFLDLD